MRCLDNSILTYFVLTVLWSTHVSGGERVVLCLLLFLEQEHLWKNLEKLIWIWKNYVNII